MATHCGPPENAVVVSGRRVFAAGRRAFAADRRGSDAASGCPPLRLLCARRQTSRGWRAVPPRPPRGAVRPRCGGGGVAEELFGPDSLPLASLRVAEASALHNLAFSNTPDEDDVGNHDKCRATILPLVQRSWALLLEVNAILLRRMESHTLLTPREEELAYAVRAQAAAIKSSGKPMPPDKALFAGAAWTGYEVALTAIDRSFSLMALPMWPTSERGSVEAFILLALDVILPQTASVRGRFSVEGSVVATIDTIMTPHTHGPAFCAAVLRKWRSVEVSRVLQARGTLQAGPAMAKSDEDTLYALQRADIAKIGLRECAWPSCDKVEKTVREFKQCSGCRSVWYCSPEHQMLDWGMHRKACSKLDAERRKAAKEDEAPK